MDIEGLGDIFLKVCKKFNQVGVDYVIGGGFAVILHGMPRLTDDIDFFVDPAPKNVSKIKRALMEIYNDEAINDIKATDIDDYSVVRYGTPEGFYLDFISRIGDFAEFSDLKKGVEYIEMENIKIPVCGIEVMLRLKGNTVRPIDQQDAIFLQEKMNRRNMGNKNKRNT